MSLDPRDRSLETLLRTSRPQPAEVSADCLDFDTLAAWIDGGLDAAALERAEAHVADCARCQAVMATLAQSSDEPSSVSQGVSLDRRWWQLNLRWLVPLAGAVTAAVVWMVVPSSRPPASLADEVVRSAPAAQEAVPSRNASDIRKREPAPAAPPAKEAPKRDQVARQGQRPQRADALEKQARGEPAPLAKAEATTDQVEAKLAAREPSAAAPRAPAAPSIAGATAESDLARDRASFAQVEPTIASRDVSVQWRVRRDGVIERSGDSGATWSATGGRAEGAVLAGASPSSNVCWLVGRAGLVMLTSDGRTWRRATAPAIADIASVEALDERQATIRTTGGASYQTIDGGATWRPGP